ncbi:MAG: hypothetical protein ACT4P9_12525 [Betaproteobacteria bacterium]
MSDSAPEAGATPPSAQPGAVSFQSDTAGMSDSQRAAMAFVDANRGEAINSNDVFLSRRISEALDHAYRNGPAPGFLPQPDSARAAQADATRPHDSLRDVFEAAAQPASEQQIGAAVDSAVVQGVNRELAERAAGICADLALSEGATRTILDRVRAHHGSSFEAGPDSDIAILTDAETQEHIAEASRLYGGTEKLEAASRQAREYLRARGVLDKFDKAGITRSSLAFDPKLLSALCAAADRAGIPRGGKG